MDERKRETRHNRIIKAVLFLALLFVAGAIIYSTVLKHPKLIHLKHKYLGYTYYSSIFNLGFKESEAEYAFDSILLNEPKFKYLLDEFYKDGYAVFFDDKFTYAWCSGNPVNSNDFSACVTFDRITKDAVNGMFVNYINDNFSEKIFFHELSHYADHKLGDLSQTEEFKKIFDKEYGSSTLSDKSYYSDISEYFAEEAAFYIIYSSLDESAYNPYGKYEDAPKSFDYIEKTLNDFKEEIDE